MGIENLLARLTAQSSGPNPKEPGGGVPEFTAADISLIASRAPSASFHALMARCCDDPISVRELGHWAFNESINEWFSNSAREAIRIEARQLKKLTALAVASWLNPHIPQAQSIEARAGWVGAAKETYRTNLHPHLAYLQQELDYLAAVGSRAIYGFKRSIEQGRESRN